MARKTSRAREDDGWNSDVIYALGLHRVVANGLGIWPLSCQDTFSKIRLFIVIISEISMGVNLIREIVGDCVAIDQVMNFVVMVMCAAVAALKVTVLRANNTKMAIVINSIVDDWSTIGDEKSKEIMKKHAKTGRCVFILQMSWCIVGIVSMALPSLLLLVTRTPDENSENTTTADHFNSSFASSLEVTRDVLQRGLPMGSGCFVPDNSSFFYAFSYILQIMQLLITSAGNIGTDVYFFSLAMHVCGQFELLKEKFQHLGGNCEMTECKEEIGELIKRHNHLIRLSNSFEDTFNILILAQLLMNGFYVSLLGIQIIISLRSGNGGAAIVAFISIYVLCLQLLLFSYAGDYLTTQMEKIKDAIYSGQWYALSQKNIKDLIFIMSRSDRTFNLTAGKIYSMNLENFKNIIKAMGSYFSVLRIIFNA